MQPFTFFVSYRREDTMPIALLLKSEIERRLPGVRVFVDAEPSQSGEPLPERVRQMIEQSHVTIALVGENWMPTAHESSSVAGDRVAMEIDVSRGAPLGMGESARYGRQERLLLPVFVGIGRDLSRFSVPAELGFLAGLAAESVGCTDWAGELAPLIDRIAIAAGLKVRPDEERYPSPDPSKPRTQPLGDEELAKVLVGENLQGWYVDDFGVRDVRCLVKTFEFQTFVQAMAFMNAAAKHCEEVGHHPEWRNVYRHVTVSLTTWDARRKVTTLDLDVARFMNEAARAVAATEE